MLLFMEECVISLSILSFFLGFIRFFFFFWGGGDVSENMHGTPCGNELNLKHYCTAVSKLTMATALQLPNLLCG